MLKYGFVTGLYLLGTLGLALADNPPVPGSAASAPAAPAAGAPQAPGFGSTLLMFLMMFAVFYFLIIRPQQKKVKEQQEMLTNLKQGDEILTSSGILGKVTGITEKVVTVEVDDGVRVKMLKSNISQVVKGQIKDLA